MAENKKSAVQTENKKVINEEKKKALEVALGQIEKQFGKGAVM